MSSAKDRKTGDPPAPSEAETLPPDTGASYVDVTATTDTPSDVEELNDDALIGQVVADRYRVQKMLGRGGMGAVFLAEHVHMKKLVALKVLHVHMSDKPDVVARFEREAVAAGRLQHPGVVGATDFGSLPDGSFYLALEFIDGASLLEVLDETGAFSPDRALGVAFQVTSALVAAHAEGIVHRDLKPDNVMLVRTEDHEDFVKVLDFGIAKIRLDGDHQEGLTRAGLVFGTPEYMSPEQAMGHEADARSDLYCVGMLLFEMLSGSSPFKHEELTAMLTAQITEAPPELPESVPAPLQKLVYELLAKDPDDRPQCAAELSERLIQVSEQLAWPLPAPRTSAGTRLDLVRRSSVDKHEVEVRVAPRSRALQSIRALSMAPLSIGSKKIPAWIPVAALLMGGGIGAAAMLANREVVPTAQQVVEQEQVDAEAQLIAEVQSGDRDAISELRKLTIVKQAELKEAGLLAASPDADTKDAKTKDAGTKEAEPSELSGAQQLLLSAQTERYMALGRGYSVIKHSLAATEMYREAVLLDPHLAEDPDLLIDMRVALGARDAVEDGLDFALEDLGSHGADLIYDVYLDHLGQPGMTPVVARAMRIVKGSDLPEQATEELQVALALQKAKYCAEYRKILPRAVRAADDRSLLKLRALKSRRGCGKFGNKDCFVCLRKDEDALDKAVERAQTHPSPTFLTPEEKAKERE